MKDKHHFCRLPFVVNVVRNLYIDLVRTNKSAFLICDLVSLRLSVFFVVVVVFVFLVLFSFCFLMLNREFNVFAKKKK